jgi:hypothetical protein
VLYDFTRRAEELRPRTPDNLHPAAGPTLEARLMFGRVKLTWPEWLAVWPRDPKDDRLPPRFGPADFELVLLPPGTGTAEVPSLVLPPTEPPPVPTDGEPFTMPSPDGSANGPPTSTERQPGAAPDAG